MAAGAGENSFLHREKACGGLESFAIGLSARKNKKATGESKEMEISSPWSRVKVFLVPTNEELMIAEETFAVTTGAHERRGINDHLRKE
jgi:acetate kinase